MAFGRRPGLVTGTAELLFPQNVIAEHEIRNISCAAQDPEDLCAFAYVTKDLQTGHHYCHVFSTVDVVGGGHAARALGAGTWRAPSRACQEQTPGAQSSSGSTRVLATAVALLLAACVFPGQGCTSPGCGLTLPRGRLPEKPSTSLLGTGSLLPPRAQLGLHPGAAGLTGGVHVAALRRGLCQGCCPRVFRAPLGTSVGALGPATASGL